MSLISNSLYLPQIDLPLKQKQKNKKDEKRVEAARRGRENYMKKLSERLLKYNQKTKMTLKKRIGYFQHDLNDPPSTLLTIEKSKRIMKKEHNTEINISIGMI